MITTSFSLKSRDRIIGLLASKCVRSILKNTFIAEGRNNAEIIRVLADENKIEILVTEFVYSVLTGTRPIVAFSELWKNKLNGEKIAVIGLDGMAWHIPDKLFDVRVLEET